MLAETEGGSAQTPNKPRFVWQPRSTGRSPTCRVERSSRSFPSLPSQKLHRSREENKLAHCAVSTGTPTIMQCGGTQRRGFSSFTFTHRLLKQRTHTSCVCDLKPKALCCHLSTIPVTTVFPEKKKFQLYFSFF